jgi:hypothetical protein
MDEAILVIQRGTCNKLKTWWNFWRQSAVYIFFDAECISMNNDLRSNLFIFTAGQNPRVFDKDQNDDGSSPFCVEKYPLSCDFPSFYPPFR